MATDVELAEVERLFADFACEIEFTRRFDGEKFYALFTSDSLGTCASVQTDEERALDGALRLLKVRLIEVMTRRA